MDAPELPPWLDATFLAAALQDGEETVPQVSVKRFSAMLAVAAGDNYMSRLYRVSVAYIIGKEEKCTSLIIKAPFTNGIIDIMTDEGDFYNKEPQIYKFCLPIMNSLVSSEFGPKSYCNNINNAVILSDLKESGYEMCDRFKQLDFPHCQQVFITLAKFHAASVACISDHPEYIEMVGKETFYRDSEKFESSLKPWLQKSLKTVAGVIKELELSKILEDMILERVETIGSSIITLCKPKTSGLNVLNHGDLWVNNILFKHTSTGDIADVRFIDFQIVRYATPALDLIYFIWSSANEEVRESRLQELLDIYTSTLNSTLEELECEERLTSEELDGDIRGAIDWVLVTVCNTVPIIVCEPEDVIDVEGMSPDELIGEPDDKYLKQYNGKHFRALLPKITEHLLTWINQFK